MEMSDNSAPKSEVKNQESLAQTLIREFDQLVGGRGVWESHWQEIAQRIWPALSFSFNPNWLTTGGAKRTEYVFDSTAALALNKFGAILDSLLTPRNQTWHRLQVSNVHLQKDRQVQLYFEQVNRLLFEYRYSPEANFTSQNQQNYKALGGFGTGCIFIDELKSEPGLRYRAIHLGEIYFVENHQGIIDRAFRSFPLTARQAVQKWGDRLPEAIRTVAKSNSEQQFKFLHVVQPREDLDVSRKDFKGMKFASFYVSKEHSTIIGEGGFTSFPYAISRYEQAPNEVYGRSPAMDVLPAIKTLNEQKKAMLKQAHRVVDPVLLAHDDGVVGNFSLRPGAINTGGVTADGRPLIHALPTGKLDIGKEMMDDERKLINDAFLISLFQILTDNPQMTATEVLERTKEKGILLAPTIGRQQSEYLGPMINREIDLLSRQGLLPPMPQLLMEAKGDYKIEYDSPLSRAQRSEEASGLMRTVESALQVVQATQNPEPLDFFNWDVIMPEISEIQGVPYRWLNTLDQVNALRAGRKQQQDTQTAIQGAPAAAAMVKAGAVAQKANAK